MALLKIVTWVFSLIKLDVWGSCGNLTQIWTVCFVEDWLMIKGSGLICYIFNVGGQLGTWAIGWEPFIWFYFSVIKEMVVRNRVMTHFHFEKYTPVIIISYVYLPDWNSTANFLSVLTFNWLVFGILWFILVGHNYKR